MCAVKDGCANPGCRHAPERLKCPAPHVTVIEHLEAVKALWVAIAVIDERIEALSSRLGRKIGDLQHELDHLAPGA